LLGLVTVWPSPLVAQRVARCPVADQIRAVAFTGSPRFDALTLATSIVTHEPGIGTRWLGLGQAPCVDSLELERDALRIAILHRQAGWYRTQVTARRTSVRGGVRITFGITPGPVVMTDTIRTTGLPDPGMADALRGLQREPLDRLRLDSAVVEVIARMRDAGHARARLTDRRIVIDSVSHRAAVDLAFAPGPVLTIGAVRVIVQPTGTTPRLTPAAVQALTGLRSGDRFRAQALREAQRQLYQLDAFRLVLLDTVTTAMPTRDSLLDLSLRVAEAKTRTARLGVGWATQDCGRVQGRLLDRGFLGAGRRLELSTRVAKLGIGAPADVAPALCSGALRQDPFSARLNYFVGASFSAARWFGTALTPTLSLYSERRGEPFAYLRETGIGALAEVARPISARTHLSAGLQYENGKTTTDPVVSCTRFGQCRPEEYVLSLFGRGVGLVNATVAHDRTNSPLDPTRGWRLRSELRAGETRSPLVSDLRFYRTTLEAAAYAQPGSSIVAARVQLSRAFAPGAALVDGAPLLPQQERLFAGGQNSVRGYQQNLLGPLVYVVAQVDTVSATDGSLVVVAAPGARVTRAVPRGGTGLLVGNFEWRRGFRVIAEQVQLAAFVDAGLVWETSSDRFRWRDVRTTPGLGVRVVTPLGPFRLDIGYQPYAPRAGRALYFAPGAGEESGQILCASPRSGGDVDAFTCPATWQPARSSGGLSRLVFHFGLGQAF
jgi:outer membrane protein insertion porin family/translocation and assembly module TamA